MEIGEVKRIACLYRVSTQQQLIEDDIPMQRMACKNYIGSMDNWELCEEYIEKGVSGFKKEINDRKVLNKLKKDAENKKFDILLVFMLDRLGRKEELMFLIKWFIDHGIEVWSTKEGHRTMDTDADVLSTFITFWQAGGESRKIQTRTLEAKKQMKDEGKFLGCAPAYGYMHISTGEHNKKGREIKKLVINEQEAKVVKRIFDLMTIQGFGTRRICRVLNEEGIPTKRGSLWVGPTVAGIIKNSIYKGYFTYGRRTNGTSKNRYCNQTDCIISHVRQTDLIIISDEQWQEAQNIINSRASRTKCNVPRQTKSPLLFIGIAYCKKCGKRLTLHYSYNHSTNALGIVANRNKKPFYVCYGKENGMCNCKAKSYSAEWLEGAVMGEIYRYMDKIARVDLSEELLEEQNIRLKMKEKAFKKKSEAILKLEKSLITLKEEIPKSILGESSFSPELLNQSIAITTEKISDSKVELEEVKAEYENSKLELTDYNLLGKSIPVWKDEFERTDIGTKRMLLAKIIDRIDVDKDEINITLNIKLEDFLKKVCV